jgi:O-acetyl-ADP-ribose deacetylase (regulator of RNase III)
MEQITVIQGNIANSDADAVVNAANRYLCAGSGVCGAIFSAAGYSELTKACSKIGTCETGHAVITPGFRLKAKYIIHAVGPDMAEVPSFEEGERLLASAYHESLVLADQQGCQSIAFPMVSTGIYGFPKDKGTEIAVATIKAFRPKSLKKVILYGYSDADVAILEKMNRK